MNFNEHKPGDKYLLKHKDGSTNECTLAYHSPLWGTYRNGKWRDYKEDYALVEWMVDESLEIREVPARFLEKIT